MAPSLQIVYVWHASAFTREVLDGLLRIGFLHHQQIIWDKGRAVLTRTPYWFAHEPCWFVKKKRTRHGTASPGENTTGWDSPSPKFIMGGSGEEKFDHPMRKPVDLMRRSILNHTKRDELVHEPFLGSGATLAAAELTKRVCCGIELDPKYADVTVQRWQELTGKKAKARWLRQDIRGNRPGARTTELMTERQRCETEIAEMERQLRSEHSDVEGLCLAPADWSAELWLIEQEMGLEKRRPAWAGLLQTWSRRSAGQLAAKPSEDV